MAPISIGIDIGGTNCKGILLNVRGESLSIIRRPTDAHMGGETVLNNCLCLIGSLIKKVNKNDLIVGIGLGTPGFLNEQGTIVGGAENLPGLQNMNLFKPISNEFGLKVTGANDVTLMTLAETRFGAGIGIKNVVGVALGTGIGGGLFLNGKLYEGSTGMAGEIGHLVVETNGLPCTCGLKGCIEQYASAPGIVRYARSVLQSLSPGETSAFAEAVKQNPKNLSSKLVYEYVEKKDPLALTIHEFISQKLAIAIGMVINIISPDMVILGGGVMMAGQVLLNRVSALVPSHCWPSISSQCRIVSAKLGENAGVIGAAALVFEKLGHDSTERMVIV